MKNIKCSVLQNDYRAIKDTPQYQNFTAFYNKMNENYCTLIQQGLLKPVSIFKRKISQVDTSDGGRGRGRGGRGRGQGSGRRGRGRGGRGHASVDLSCLPRELDLQNLNSFTNEQWYGFSQEQRQAIWALRKIHRGNNKDDVSLLGQGSFKRESNTRQVYQLVQMPPLPPAPYNYSPPQPPNQPHNEVSTRSTNAGSAFSR